MNKTCFSAGFGLAELTFLSLNAIERTGLFSGDISSAKSGFRYDRIVLEISRRCASLDMTGKFFGFVILPMCAPASLSGFFRGSWVSI